MQGVDLGTSTRDVNPILADLRRKVPQMINFMSIRISRFWICRTSFSAHGQGRSTGGEQRAVLLAERGALLMSI